MKEVYELKVGDKIEIYKYLPASDYWGASYDAVIKNNSTCIFTIYRAHYSVYNKDYCFQIVEGWYRCALYFTSSVASGPQNIQYHLADADNNLTYTGISGTGSYMWGAQFENGNVLGPYRATTTTGFTTGSMLDQMKFNLKNTGSFSGSYFGNWNGGYSGNKPDGVSAYMSTGLNASTQLATSSNSITYYSRTDSSGSYTDIGALS